MNKFKTKHIKEYIEELEMKKATNEVAMLWNKEPERAETAEAKKIVDSCIHANEDIDKKLVWLKAQLKSLE